jgi:hypothetical protein
VKIVVREQIKRPPEVVYRTLRHPDRFLKKWSRGVLAVAVTPPIGSAPTYQITGRSLAGTARWTYELVDAEPDERLEGRTQDGPVPFDESFSLRVLPGGSTEVIHIHEIRPAGLFGLLSPALNIVWTRLMQQNLRRLKVFVEAGG